MKPLVLSILALVAGSLAGAAQCSALREEQAKQALIALQPGTTFVEYCEACGDTKPRRVGTVESVSIERRESLWTLSVNGSVKDVANVWVQGSPGQFENVAVAAGCAGKNTRRTLQLPVAPSSRRG